MNENEQIEVHYMDNGYSYPVSEGYVDFFGGAPTPPSNYLNFAPMLDQVKFVCYEFLHKFDNVLKKNWFP